MIEPATSVSPLRVLIVLIVLVAVGMVAGASCAVAVVTLLGAFDELAGPAGFMGAVFGALLAPIAGFSLLRRVALGRAILWTSVGTVLGGLAGTGLVEVFNDFNFYLLGPLAGFGIAAFRLTRGEPGKRKRGLIP